MFNLIFSLLVYSDEVSVFLTHQEGPLEDVLPSDYREGKQLLNYSATDDKSSYCRTTTMSDPTRCMHDGSQLYMLKPVIPPPSFESVTSWLHNEEGIPIDRTSFFVIHSISC